MKLESMQRIVDQGVTSLWKSYDSIGQLPARRRRGVRNQIIQIANNLQSARLKITDVLGCVSYPRIDRYVAKP